MNMIDLLFILPPLLIPIVISLFLRNSLYDSDFAGLHYPGYALAKGYISWDFFHKDLVGSPGNKTFVQYLNSFLYKIIGGDVPRVRLFYGVWAGFSSVLLYGLIMVMTRNSLAAFTSSICFSGLSVHPILFTHFENAERYALLHSLLHFLTIILAISSDHAGWAAIAAIVFIPMPFLHKPLYVFDVLAGIILLMIQSTLLSVCVYMGILVSIPMVLLLCLDYQDRKRLLEGVFDFRSGFYRYWLTFGRSLSLKGVLKDIMLFSPAVMLRLLPPIFILLLLPYELLISKTVLSCLVLLAASLLIPLVQLRFYPYHYIPLILPISILSGIIINESSVSLGTILIIVYLLFLYLDLLILCKQTPEKLNQKLCAPIPHYGTRNLVAWKIGTKLRKMTSSTDTILVWGDTPQVYLYADRVPSYHFLELVPTAFTCYPNKLQHFLSQINESPPLYIAVMLNNINWETLQRVTGYYYEFVDAVVCNEEWFPIYKLSEVKTHRSDIGSISGDLFFIDCLKKNPDRKIFNPLPKVRDKDPNPTVCDIID